MTDPWDEKPELVDPYWYDQHGENLPDADRYYITKEEYEEAITAWLEKLKVEHELLKEHSGRWLHFVAVDYPEIKESLSPQELMELKEKAEKWDKVVQNKDSPLQLTMKYIKLEDKLEAVKNYCKNTLGTTEDFPNWMKPVRDEMKHILKILEASE